MAEAIDAENPLAALNALSDELENHNYSPAMATVRAIAVDGIRQAFATATSPDGATWPPAGSTSTDRSSSQNLRKIKPLLVDTGAMLGAATGRNAGTAGGGDRNSVEVGVQDNEVFYAKFHQFGTKNKDGSQKLPPRPFVGINDDNINKSAEAIADHTIREVFK